MLSFNFSSGWSGKVWYLWFIVFSKFASMTTIASHINTYINGRAEEFNSNRMCHLIDNNRNCIRLSWRFLKHKWRRIEASQFTWQNRFSENIVSSWANSKNFETQVSWTQVNFIINASLSRDPLNYIRSFESQIKQTSTNSN